MKVELAGHADKLVIRMCDMRENETRKDIQEFNIRNRSDGAL